MARRMLLKSILFIFTVVSWSTDSARASDDLRAKLALPVQNYALNAENFLLAVTHLAEEFRIPLGIAWVDSPAAETKVRLFWKNSTLQGVLEDLLKTQRDYELWVSDDVVHVRCRSIRPSQDFLQLPINKFEVRDQVVHTAQQKLRELVRYSVSPRHNATKGGVISSFITNVGEPTFDLSLNNATVEKILDALTKVSTKKIWIVTYVDSFIPASTGFRRTLTLWSSSPIPDDDQPVWNLFGWSEPIPTAGLGFKPVS